MRPKWVETGMRRWGLELALCLARYAREVGLARAERWQARGRAWIAIEAKNGFVLAE